jgi:hypothetical protein
VTDGRRGEDNVENSANFARGSRVTDGGGGWVHGTETTDGTDSMKGEVVAFSRFSGVGIDLRLGVYGR